MNLNDKPQTQLRRSAVILPLLFIALALIGGCGRGALQETISAEEQWTIAKAHFENQNFLDAIDLLNTFTLNYGGSTLVDSAQFLLAECHFLMKEYIVAESEYEILVRKYPQSPLVEAASLKIVLCNAYLVPNVNLDQYYSTQTANSALSFLDEYPSSNLALRLTLKKSLGASLAQIFTLGAITPKKRTLLDTPIFHTKVVYSYRSAPLGRWFLRVITLGLYRPAPAPIIIPKAQEVSGSWLVNKALTDSRNQLAEKEYRAAKLYFKQKKYPSVVIYGDRILDIYKDTPWAAPALQLKGDAFWAMKKYQEAGAAYQEYLNIPGRSGDLEVEHKLQDCQPYLNGSDKITQPG